MKHYTLEDIRKAEQDFIPCPFCGKKPTLVFSDDECNWKDQDSEEYLQDPWSGLCFSICHENRDCPIEPAELDIGRVYSGCYDTPEEAVADWNDHLKKMGADHGSSLSKCNHGRFSDWNEAYEAWKKEANPPHPDSLAFTEQGSAMKMVWLFAKWLYSAVDGRNA